MRKSWKWILISVHIRLIGGFNAHEQCARQRGASSQIWKKITNIPNMSTPATPEHNFSAVFPNNNWIMFCFTYPLVIKHGNGKQHLWFPIRTSNSRACSIEFPLIFHWFSIDVPLIFHWFSIDFPLSHLIFIDFPLIFQGVSTFSSVSVIFHRVVRNGEKIVAAAPIFFVGAPEQRQQQTDLLARGLESWGSTRQPSNARTLSLVTIEAYIIYILSIYYLYIIYILSIYYHW